MPIGTAWRGDRSWSSAFPSFSRDNLRFQTAPTWTMRNIHRLTTRQTLERKELQMKAASFENVKQALGEACEFLRSFTLGRHGFSQQDGIAGIRRVNSRCSRMERLFADGLDAKRSKTVVDSARSQVLAAEARLALLRKDK
jgi:hypothetical protein